MKRSSGNVVLACLLVVLPACSSIRAPQLEFLMNTIRSPGAEVGEQLAALSWTLSWLGDDERYFAGLVENRTIFVSERESFVVFDGWNVIRTRGLVPGAGRSDVAIEADPERRWLRFADPTTGAVRVECEAFTSQARSGGGLLWEQRCEGLLAANEIEVDAEGRMVALRFIAHPAYPAVRLRFSGESPSRNR